MIIQTLNRPWLRWPLFIVLFAAGYAGSTTLPLLSAYSNLPLVGAAISSVFSAINLAGLSDPKFAYALASAMTSVAAGLILAFGSVVFVRTLAISEARRLFSRVSSPAQLVEAFELIDQKASANPVIGLAWSEFRKTSQRGEKAIELGQLQIAQHLLRHGRKSAQQHRDHQIDLLLDGRGDGDLLKELGVVDEIVHRNGLEDVLLAPELHREDDLGRDRIEVEKFRIGRAGHGVLWRMQKD